MSKVTNAMITERLGGPPEAWTFSGQCFDAGEECELKCAILQRRARYFLTLKHADGSPGHRYISFEAVPVFKYRNPALYRRLMLGVAFLEIRNHVVDRQECWRKDNGKGPGQKGTR